MLIGQKYPFPFPFSTSAHIIMFSKEMPFNYFYHKHEHALCTLRHHRSLLGLKQDTFSLLWHMLLFSSCILEDIFFSSTAFWIIKIPILLHSQHNSMIMLTIVRQLRRELKGGSSVPRRPMCRNNTYTCGSMAVLVAPVADMPLSAANTKILKLSLLPTE